MYTVPGRLTRSLFRYWFWIIPVLAAAFLIPVWQSGEAGLEDDPDLPPGLHIDKGEYIAAREEQLGLMRGIDTAEPAARSRAIREMEQDEAKAKVARRSEAAPPVPNWRPM